MRVLRLDMSVQHTISAYIRFLALKGTQSSSKNWSVRDFKSIHTSVIDASQRLTRPFEVESVPVKSVIDHLLLAQLERHSQLSLT
jgi:hypothetical protein